MKHFGINLHHFQSFSISFLLLYPTPENFTGFINNAIMDVDDECDGIGKLMINKTCKLFRSRIKQ